MNKKELKELVFITTAVRAAEQKDGGWTSTMASIIDAMHLVKTAEKLDDLVGYMERGIRIVKHSTEYSPRTRWI